MEPQDTAPEVNLYAEGVPLESGTLANGTPGAARLSPKDRALIAAAYAFSAKCDRCATDLSRLAIDLGVTREELLEVAGMVQSAGYECEQGHRADETTLASGERRFSEWHWAQDDGCVLGNWD